MGNLVYYISMLVITTGKVKMKIKTDQLLGLLVIIMVTALLYRIIETTLVYNNGVTPESEPVVSEQLSGDLLTQVNSVRKASGCKQDLVVNEQLTAAAQERAEHIAAGNWSHEGYQEAVKRHYDYRLLGENLARNFSSDEEIVNAWMNSEKHRKVMLNCRYTETGIGRSGAYVAQEFATR